MRKKNYTKNKWTKIYATEIPYEKELKDAELRLFHIYLRIVDWDLKHTETVGSSDITQRELLDLLPEKKPNERNWSLAKVNSVLQCLVKKGWLEKRPDKRTAVKNYKMYRFRGKDSVQLTERFIHLTRQDVQLDKPLVQQTEKSKEFSFVDLYKKRQGLIDKTKVIVHSAEQDADSKDN